ncbi:hypothetical protein [Ottowia sp. VDI28]|uniref:hypothetical protein n=1 Tax=Ottowia sp. VDI28 TaxID=3133968 RepID=UPI003C2C5948
MAAVIDFKAFDTLRAQAALQGYSCGCTAEGWIVIRRFGMSAVFDTVSDAAHWLEHGDKGLA